MLSFKVSFKKIFKIYLIYYLAVKERVCLFRVVEINIGTDSVPGFRTVSYAFRKTNLYHRAVVGWSMSDRLTASQTTEAALYHAYRRYGIPWGLIFHSDRGIQYAARSFRKLLKKYKGIQSMSGKGNCYDNAVAESFFKTLKAELVYQCSFKTRKEARAAIFDYIETFYNILRKHSTMGYNTPLQYLTKYYDKKKPNHVL
ncbi:MAG: IS3 family transposase [Bacteroidales bacterium]